MPDVTGVDQSVRGSIARAASVPLDTIRMDVTIDQLGIDSLAAMGLIVDLETELSVIVPMNASAPLHGSSTVQDVITFFELLVSETHGGNA